MKIATNLLATLILIFGFSMLIKPEIIFRWMEGNMENRSLYLAAIVFRLVLGTVFIVAAKKSEYPAVIKFIGYVAIMAAVAFLLMGFGNFRHLLVNVTSLFRPYAVIIGLIGMTLGLFLIYAFRPTNE